MCPHRGTLCNPLNWEMMSSMDRAPIWRRTGANLIDAALLGGLWWLARSRGWVRDGGRVARLLALPGDPLREQLRSPGQRLLGTATVDPRTGGRLAVWRTVAIVAAGAAAQELTRRLEPVTSDEQQRRRDAYVSEMTAIMARHPQPSPERDAERRSLEERHPAPSLLRAAAPPIAAGVLTTRLRRRLAPTVEVLAQRRSDHSP